MSSHYPRIRILAQGGFSLLREGLSLSFYIRCPHQEIARQVLSTLDIYSTAMGASALGWYADENGEAQELDTAAGWKRVRSELLEEECPVVRLADESPTESRYGFEYYGQLLTNPFNEDNLDPAFTGPTNLLGVMRLIRERCFRYPGMDIPDLGQLRMYLGSRVRGPSWLTFLGQPVLGELQGASGLRSRLHSPTTTVQELEGERALVTLGEWPEAGDLEHGQTLPAYRELARVLEPWLYQEPRSSPGSPFDDFTPEDQARWERRFLDGP